jgi:hypothetical protein
MAHRRYWTRADWFFGLSCAVAAHEVRRAGALGERRLLGFHARHSFIPRMLYFLWLEVPATVLAYGAADWLIVLTLSFTGWLGGACLLLFTALGCVQLLKGLLRAAFRFGV